MIQNDSVDALIAYIYMLMYITGQLGILVFQVKNLLDHVLVFLYILTLYRKKKRKKGKLFMEKEDI